MQIMWSVHSVGCVAVVGHRLKLNADKSELVRTCSRHNMSLLGGCCLSIHLGDDLVKPCDHVRLLDVTIASDLVLTGMF